MASYYSGKGAPLNGSVYVCNLPEGTDENMLAEHFGTIGLLKVVSSPPEGGASFVLFYSLCLAFSTFFFSV